MRRFWQCPECGGILIKEQATQAVKSRLAGLMGNATCSFCSTVQRARDVYGGVFDFANDDNFIEAMGADTDSLSFDHDLMRYRYRGEVVALATDAPPVNARPVGSCPSCGKDLPERQIQRLGKSGYNAWFSEGYCSATCYRPTQVAEALQVPRWKLEVDQLAAKGQLNEVDIMGFTALCMATRTADEDKALALIRAGADVNRAIATGATPLHFATANNLPTVVEALVQAGAETSGRAPVIGDKRQTPREIAIAKRYTAVLAALPD